ncbi:RING finger protein 214 [Aplochiton taeniatus]
MDDIDLGSTQGMALLRKNSVVDTLASGDGPHVPHSNFHWHQREEQGVQTDVWTADKDVNTDQDWESQMTAMGVHSNLLAEQYEELMRQQQDEEVEHEKHKASLSKKKEEGVRQQQALLEKIESLRVKLKLNCCKTTRKNFAAKKQELMTEKNKMEEEKNRLSVELEEGSRKLMVLIEEQNQEKQTWSTELAQLNKEMERLQKEAQEADQKALQDEIAALLTQRDVIMTQIEDWLKEVEQYLNTPRIENPQMQHHKRQEWEKHKNMVRNQQLELNVLFNEHLQLLKQGRDLESLPSINHPTLPQIPTVELLLSQIMLPPARPPFPFFQMGPPPQAGIPFPPQQHFPFRSQMIVTPPPNPSPTPPPAQSSQQATPPPSSHPTGTSPRPNLPPNNPPPAGKLEKLLEKLGATFPQCTRAQLMSVLQQIKTSRGTMAGLSMDEVNQQVALRLPQSDSPALVAGRGYPGAPTAIHRPLGPIQRPAALLHRPMAESQGFQRRPSQPVAASNRKLCLMCQNHVDPETQHPMSCTHTVHKECISVWLQSSKNNSCPFCPAH